MTPKYDFDHVHTRRGTNCVKWDLTPEDALPLWVADMDFHSPPEVRDALAAVVEHNIFGYPYFGTSGQEAVAEWVAERHGWEVSPESVMLLPAVVAGFNMAATAFASPGEGILIQPPAYGPFLEVAGNHGFIQQEAVLKPDADGKFNIDLDAFEAAITPETRVFLLCNPHNPTGRVFTREELAGMAEICMRHNVVICSDEIHSDLVYSGHRHIPIAALDKEISARTVTLIAPSKTFNVAGLKASAAIIEDEEMRKQFEAAKKGLVGFFVNMMGATALEAAYRHGGPWLDALMAYLEENRNLLAEFVANRLPGVNMHTPEGTFLAWLDCRSLDLPKGETIIPHFNYFFSKEAGVVLNEGAWFGTGGEGFVRLNFATSRQVLVEALERMEAALIP